MAQYARPDSDITFSNWTGSYTAIDEASYDDGDYIQGANNNNGSAEVGLSDVADPVSSSDHVLRFRAWQQNNTKNRQLTAYLFQGTTQIASYACGNLVKDTPTAYSYTLTGAEADSITDYTDLWLRFTSYGDVGTPASQRSYVYVSWTELEVPDSSFYSKTVTDTGAGADALGGIAVA